MPTRQSARPKDITQEIPALNGNGGVRRMQSSLASIGTLVTLLVQTSVAVWWASGISTDVAYLKMFYTRTEAAITLIEGTRFTATEEKSYRQENNERLLRLEERIRQLEIHAK